MPVVAVRIPQIGEGLQEARLVAVLKQPGDHVKRDEPIYQMETDKAVMDVESPYEGTLTEWLAPVDTILPIGGEVARMEVSDGVEEVGGGHGPAPTVITAPPASEAAVGPRLQGIPPRTRAYAKEKGISDDVLAALSPAGSKLMPSDIDSHLAGGGSSPVGYNESAVPGKQRVLNSRMVRGNAVVVPGTISIAVSWEGIDNVRARVKSGGGEFQPSAFTMLAYMVAQVLKDFPSFRTTIPNDETYRTYAHANLGIAVSLPGDELVLAVVDDSDALTWREFAQRCREKIDLARSGKDQANESVTISLTNMQNYGLRDAVPVVVPPSVATLFIGEIYNAQDPASAEPKIRRTCNLALTFDHRVINGAGAANFMKAIKEKIETATAQIPME
jgi:pyruvate/2-oxoglutarate dehydrogenase complex dihydrolipoamide acyltransferase (E2) component